MQMDHLLDRSTLSKANLVHPRQAGEPRVEPAEDEGARRQRGGGFLRPIWVHGVRRVGARAIRCDLSAFHALRAGFGACSGWSLFLVGWTRGGDSTRGACTGAEIGEFIPCASGESFELLLRTAGRGAFRGLRERVLRQGSFLWSSEQLLQRRQQLRVAIGVESSIAASGTGMFVMKLMRNPASYSESCWRLGILRRIQAEEARAQNLDLASCKDAKEAEEEARARGNLEFCTS